MTTGLVPQVDALTDVDELTSRSASRQLERVALSWSTVDQIAAGQADAATGAALLDAERSHRAVLLRAVLDLARAAGALATGPLEGVDVAWDLLVDAQRVNARQTSVVLTLPETGAWAAHVLRRLRSGQPDDPRTWPEPLWVDVGYLHAIAASAAVRANVRARLRVPARRGEVTLPTVGRARGPYRESWEPAVVAIGDEAVSVSANGWRIGPGRDEAGLVADPAASWRKHRWVRVGPARARLTVDLDDASPYRMLLGTAAPNRLGNDAAQRWERVLDEAWAILRETDSHQADALALATSTIVPLPADGSAGILSASAGDAFGKVLVAEPHDGEQLAATLVHEFYHAQLGVLMHLTDIVVASETSEDHFFYSPWRDDPRPLRGLMQGTFAFFGVAGFWRGRARLAGAEMGARAYFEFDLWRRRVDIALRRVRCRPELTAVGARFFDGASAVVDEWMRETVPQTVGDLARLAVGDHYGRWRIHHLHPPNTVVESLAKAWRRRASLPALDLAGTAVVPDPSARHLDAVAYATRGWLAHETTSEMTNPLLPRSVAGAEKGELLLVAGRYDEARAAYVDELLAEPDRAGAWTGLGRALAATGEPAAAQALRARPELVRAVATAIAAGGDRQAAPVDLAIWIGDGLSTGPDE